MLFKLCVASALMISVCHGQAFFNGPCKDYNAHIVENFDVEKYMGRWFELKRFETFFQKGADCVTADYSIGGVNNVTVVNKGIILQTNKDMVIEGYAYQTEPDLNQGKLKVQFPLVPAGDYWVIGTDYENYSVVWTCHPIGSGNFQFMWILSRTSTMSQAIQDKVKQIIVDAKINPASLRATNNDPETCGIKRA